MRRGPAVRRLYHVFGSVAPLKPLHVRYEATNKNDAEAVARRWLKGRQPGATARVVNVETGEVAAEYVVDNRGFPIPKEA